MNALTPRAAGAVASLQTLKQGLANVVSHLKSSSTDPFLRMGTDGMWVYSADNVEVQEGSQWAVNPLSLQHGYAAWTNYPADLRKANELLGERMVAMTQALPDFNGLPDVGFAWKEQVSFQLQCISGEDKGEQVLYKTTSVGGMRVVRSLIDTIMEHLDVDPENPVPIICLESDSYKHKTYGKTYVPIFAIKGWAPLGGEAPGEVETVKDTVAETRPAAAPARKRRAAVTATEQKAEAPAETQQVNTVPEKPMTAKEKLLAELAAIEAQEQASQMASQEANEPENTRDPKSPEPAQGDGQVRRRRRVA